MWPIWLSFWGRFDLGSIWLGPIWLEVGSVIDNTMVNTCAQFKFGILHVQISKIKIHGVYP
jgi:hypothetical protein